MLEDKIVEKLEQTIKKFEEIKEQLNNLNVGIEQERFKKLSKEFSELQPVVEAFTTYKAKIDEIEDLKVIEQEEDLDFAEITKEEILLIEKQLKNLEFEIKQMLLPQDENDKANIYMEIRAAAGGDESAIFAGDLLKMYTKYALIKNWNCEILSHHEGSHGGYKEVTLKLSGKYVYSYLKFESGTHRVQRVPETEAQGRVHTSTCTVAILPELKDINQIKVNKDELKIDTFRASGAGGQHVNKTDSAIRITHEPTGLVVECQEERSQHKNKAKAIALLQAKLLDKARTKQINEQAEERRSLIGSGDRSERIRTYNYPQSRVSDHRINLTLYKLEEIMEGNLEETLIIPLRNQHAANLMAHFD